MRTCCSIQPSFRPRVCIRDLSQMTQCFLRLHCSINGVTAHEYNKDHQDKFDQLATLQVKHGVLLNMELTSKLHFSSAIDVLDFLRADFSKPADVNHRYQQTFLQGRIASCANRFCPPKE